MAETLVSLLVKQLGPIAAGLLEKEMRLTVCAEKEVEKIKSNLTAIQAVLADAETRQVKEANVRDWLGKLKDVAYDIEDVLGDWEDAIRSSEDMPGDERLERKVCSFLWSLMTLIPCFCCKQVGLRRDIARKIKELNERLELIAQEKKRYKFISTEANQTIGRSTTISKIDITEVEGRDHVKDALLKMLSSEPTVVDRRGLPVISIVGMGGIGKTTLAQFVFNHNSIETYFDKKVWVCVSDPFDEIRVAKAIFVSLLDSTPAVIELEYLMQKIGERIKEKKVLLILDDVWEENPEKWDTLKKPLGHALSGSKVLVTTRNDRVASAMGCTNDDILHVEKLSEEECWLILSKIAFFGRDDRECKHLEELGKKISSKCKGLPLAAKALGSTLRFRKTREKWQQILDSEIWEVKEVQTNVLGPLWLSYYDLSPELKRCFSYCAIFPKDYEINKSELIELWNAQGYLMGTQGDDLETVGEDYFENLVLRSFFQNFEYDDQSIYSCKMHDIVHDLAQIVARSECRSARVDDPVESIKKVRHLSLSLPEHGSYLNVSLNFDKKRSLFLWSKPKTEELSSLLGELPHVRSLSLRDSDLEEIPSSVSKLVQLRWLDLSHNRGLEQLPETLCELHSLQTIDVSYCYSQLKLPLGIGKLNNLRHLHNCDGPSRLPKGIGQLTGLRTLEDVDVGCGGDAFSLGDLKNLNQLRGKLRIRNLGKHNRHLGEAEQAELNKKEHVTTLVLAFFNKGGGEERCTPRNEELLLEALEPSPNLETLKEEEEGGGEDEGEGGEQQCTPRKEELLLEALEPSPNLERLCISDYGGTSFPGWMISLTNLRSIELWNCVFCEHLPSLGKLPSLETLQLWEMKSVKKVGPELLGIETQIGDSKSEISASSSSPVVVAFPKLTTLGFSLMDSWEEWEDYYDGTTRPPPIIIMPSLRSLTISLCPRLKALPDYILQSTTLDILHISQSNLLEERYDKEKGKDRSKISHIADLQIVPPQSFCNIM